MKSGYDKITLPDGIRRRFIDTGNGLTMHILEAGDNQPNRPMLLLLHGFPELAFSWRKVMGPLADAGYYVVAPDQRGYGRTTGWDGTYDGDLTSFRVLNLVRDAVALIHSLDRDHVAAVIGHDFGSPVAANAALVRPDIFQAVALMSAPYGGPPNWLDPLDFGKPMTQVHDDLAGLATPRKHYQWYYSTRAADDDMRRCRQGIHDFLRAYYHVKSADWAENQPYKLAAWKAQELAKLPRYYVMDLEATMAETVAPEMPDKDEISACTWLRDAELAVYSEEYDRIGFQGGLQWYRCSTGLAQAQELRLFAGRKIDVPSCFIAGASDWGTYQVPGAFERMQTQACTDFRGAHLLDGAGHWVQQEQPDATAQVLNDFLKGL